MGRHTVFCSVVKMRKRQKEEDTQGDMLYMLRGIILMEFLAPDKIANILMANILAVMTHDTFYKTAAVLVVKSEKYYSYLILHILDFTLYIHLLKNLITSHHYHKCKTGLKQG